MPAREKSADWALLPETKEEVLERFKQIDVTEQHLVRSRIMETRGVLKTLRFGFLYGTEMVRDEQQGIVFRQPKMPSYLDEAWETCTWLLEKTKEFMLGGT